MDRSSVRITIIIFILMAFLLPSCGGGGEESGVSSPAEEVFQPAIPTEIGTALEWDPPEVTADGTPMDSRRDLDYYEFYLRTDQNFGDDDLPVAYVSSYTDVPSYTGESFKRFLTKEFFLENLLPFVETGKQYYVSIRAVGVDGQKSDFMDPVAWDLS